MYYKMSSPLWEGEETKPRFHVLKVSSYSPGEATKKISASFPLGMDTPVVATDWVLEELLILFRPTVYVTV